MISFKKEFDKVVDVNSVKLFSFGVKEIQSVDQIGFAAGNRKNSSLCGFTFTSLGNTQMPKFHVMFVSKLRSKIGHNTGHNPSMWYAMRALPNGGVQVLTPDMLAAQYRFDLAKFFDSDLFKGGLKKMKDCIEKGITQSEEFCKKVELERKSECETYIKAIKEALGKLDDSVQFRSSFKQQKSFSDPLKKAPKN